MWFFISFLYTFGDTLNSEHIFLLCADNEFWLLGANICTLTDTASLHGYSKKIEDDKWGPIELLLVNILFYS